MSKKFKSKHFYPHGGCRHEHHHDHDPQVDMLIDILTVAEANPASSGKNRHYWKPTLTIEEKQWLKGVVRPFRDRIMSISIQQGEHDDEFLSLTYQGKDKVRYITFPSFEKRRQYKGLERGVNFTLNDLDL